MDIDTSNAEAMFAIFFENEVRAIYHDLSARLNRHSKKQFTDLDENLLGLFRHIDMYTVLKRESPICIIESIPSSNQHRKNVLQAGRSLGFTNICFRTVDQCYVRQLIARNPIFIAFEKPAPSDGHCYCSMSYSASGTLKGFVWKRNGQVMMLKKLKYLDNVFTAAEAKRFFDHLTYCIPVIAPNVVTTFDHPEELFRAIPHVFPVEINKGQNTPDSIIITDGAILEFDKTTSIFNVRSGLQIPHQSLFNLLFDDLVWKCCFRELPFEDSIFLVKRSQKLSVYMHYAFHSEALLFDTIDLTEVGDVGDMFKLHMVFYVNGLIDFRVIPKSNDLSSTIQFSLGHRKVSIQRIVNGKPEIVKSPMGKNFIPAVLSFRRERAVVGELAEEDLSETGSYVVMDLMKLVGRKLSELQKSEHWPFRIVPMENDEFCVNVNTFAGPKQTHATMMLALVLKAMAKHIESTFNELVKEVRFVLPTDFDQEKLREAVSEAAQSAGFRALF